MLTTRDLDRLIDKLYEQAEYHVREANLKCPEDWTARMAASYMLGSLATCLSSLPLEKESSK